MQAAGLEGGQGDSGEGQATELMKNYWSGICLTHIPKKILAGLEKV
jgi:hypothetical protein